MKVIHKQTGKILYASEEYATYFLWNNPLWPLAMAYPAYRLRKPAWEKLNDLPVLPILEASTKGDTWIKK